MTREEFLEKSDAKFYERITLGLAVILGLLGIIFIGSGFANVTDNVPDTIFRLVFGGALIFGFGKLALDRFPEIGSVCKAMLKECYATASSTVAAYFGLISRATKNLAKLLRGGNDAD